MKTRNFFAAVGALAIAGASLVGAAYAGPEHNHGDKAHATASVGHAAPNFTLTDTDGKVHTLADLKGKTVVLEWFNPGCPFVVRHYQAKTSVNTFNEFKDQGVVWIAINSGAPGKEGSGLELNKKMKAEWAIPFAVALDESGDVGRLYGAKTTPHMFVINKDGMITYAGAIDSDPSGKDAKATNYVANALRQTLAGETVTEATTKPYGCSVKYAK
ncbi:MAG: redoxin domain-containing protein [Phycisphaerales bacterium]|nr:redoxin domain-containing protein [Phycisphaerales bacterium]